MLDLLVAPDSSILQRDAFPNSSTNASSAATLPLVVPQPAHAARVGLDGTSSNMLAVLNTFSQLTLEQRCTLFPVLGTFTETPQAPMLDDAPPSYSD